MTLLERLLGAGYPKEQVYHYHSDLYVFVTPLTTKIIREWCNEFGHDMNWNFPIFTDNVTGKKMYDCAFQYHNID